MYFDNLKSEKDIFIIFHKTSGEESNCSCHMGSVSTQIMYWASLFFWAG